jgi:hypothetical protein
MMPVTTNSEDGGGKGGRKLQNRLDPDMLPGNNYHAVTFMTYIVIYCLQPVTAVDTSLRNEHM